MNNEDAKRVSQLDEQFQALRVQLTRYEELLNIGANRLSSILRSDIARPMKDKEGKEVENTLVPAADNLRGQVRLLAELNVRLETMIESAEN